ncbi:MAG: Hpt domain-containing protein [Thermodesulfovibrionales bacterium]
MMNRDDRYDLLRSSFLATAKEWIIDIENGVLRLEKAPDDGDELSALLRIVHSIKGSGSVFGLEEVQRFAHGMEDLLSSLQRLSGPVRQEGIDALLDATDLLWSLLDAAASGESFDFSPCEVWLHRHGKVRE